MVCVPIFPEDPYWTTKRPCNDQGGTAFLSCNLAGSGAIVPTGFDRLVAPYRSVRL